MSTNASATTVAADAPGGQHRHRGVRAVQRLVEFAPASGGLALWAHHADADDAPEAAAGAPAWTDGHTIFYGPAFEALPLPEQAGWLAHEVLHLALRHPARCAELEQRLGDVDRELFNLCADAIVNSALAPLGWLRLAPGSLRLEPLLRAVLDAPQDDAAALLQWDVERLYRTMDDRRQGDDLDDDRKDPRKDRRQDGRRGEPRDGEPGRSGEKTEGHAPDRRRDGPRSARLRALRPRGSAGAPDLCPRPGSAARPEQEAELAREWRERLVRAQAGDGELSLARALLADLPRVRTPWEQVLRRVVARALAQRPGPSWSRPARSYLANQGRSASGHRLPWEPGTTSARRAPRLAVVVDTSGSIEGGLLDRFARELHALVRRLEAALAIVVGDDRVRHVEHHEPGRGRLPALAFAGGGGTDFTPLLEEAARHRPDLVVVLTDLEGPARHRPSCPVLWVVPETHALAEPPFGRKLVLD